MSPNDPDPLTECAIRLDEAGIKYMLTGSVAGYFYGLNRATADTDIILAIVPSQVPAFVAAFKDAYFVDPLTVEQSVRERDMFNVMPRAGGKFDFIVLKPFASELEKFARREVFDWHGYPLWVATAPDLVLSKLEWARSSHSSMQFSDIRTIMGSGAVDENDPYFARQLDRLNLREVLDACYAQGHQA